MSLIKLMTASCMIFTLMCSSGGASREESRASYTQNAGQNKAYQPDQTKELSNQSGHENIPKGSLIIKNGTMRLEVDGLESSKSRVDEMISEYQGYYENESYKAYANKRSYSLIIRVPNSSFDSLVIDLESSLGELKNKNIRATDVTEEYVDLNLRLENNLSYLAQYKEILKRAKTVEEILEVQEKIRRIEEEIESKKGRLKYLDDQVKYSTLNLEISELLTTNLSRKKKYGKRILNAFNNGIQGFLEFTIVLVTLWPFLLLLVLLIIGWKPMWRWLRRKKSNGNK